mmetsp:Transcript_43196/g.133452  ORF Transcript_43196/g.133452 Transcript_43196/m.133452 type:complete len:229 (+) Transcript_43196:1326-2012(+)
MRRSPSQLLRSADLRAAHLASTAASSASSAVQRDHPTYDRAVQSEKALSPRATTARGSATVSNAAHASNALSATLASSSQALRSTVTTPERRRPQLIVRSRALPTTCCTAIVEGKSAQKLVSNARAVASAANATLAGASTRREGGAPGVPVGDGRTTTKVAEAASYHVSIILRRATLAHPSRGRSRRRIATTPKSCRALSMRPTALAAAEASSPRGSSETSTHGHSIS